MNFAGVFFFQNLHEGYEESSPVMCEGDLPSPLELRDGLWPLILNFCNCFQILSS
jgi:hypothetical protein